MLVPVHLLKSKSLPCIHCCWAPPLLPAPSGSHRAINMLAGGLGDPEQEGALSLSLPAAQIASLVPREGKATSCSPPCLLTLCSGGCSGHSSIGRPWDPHSSRPGGNLLHFLWHSCGRLSYAAPEAWYKPILFMFASKWCCEIMEAFARNWENQLPNLKFRNESFCSWTLAIKH